MAGAKAGNSNVMVSIKVMEDPHIFWPPGGYPQKQHQRSKPTRVHRRFREIKKITEVWVIK